MTTQLDTEIDTSSVFVFADKKLAIDFYKHKKAQFDNNVFYNYAGMHKQHLIFERLTIKSGVETEVVDSTNY
jgi:hypothetical protein